MKYIYRIACLIAVLGVVSCVTTQENKLEDVQVKIQASAYAAKYQETVLGFLPTLAVFQNGYLSETIFFQAKGGDVSIVHAIYDKSPYEQFIDFIQANNLVIYSDIVDNIEPDFTNHIEHERYSYRGEDCLSIVKALSSIRELSLDYSHKIPYSYNPDKAVYTYSYVDKDNGRTSYNVTTYIAEHPVSEIYRIAKKGIKNCPHQETVPKYD